MLKSSPYVQVMRQESGAEQNPWVLRRWKISKTRANFINFMHLLFRAKAKAEARDGLQSCHRRRQQKNNSCRSSCVGRSHRLRSENIWPAALNDSPGVGSAPAIFEPDEKMYGDCAIELSFMMCLFHTP